jgi:hypothetical protein
MVIALLSSQVVYWSVKRLQVSGVRASAFSSLLFALLLCTLNIPNSDFLSAAWLGGSFLGMSRPETFSARELFFGALIYGFLYIYVLPLNIGLGGALGFAAFVTCGLLRTVYWLRAHLK